MIKEGWVRINDNLSEFHRWLINTFPKYASIAVQEMMLPASIEALPLTEQVARLAEERRAAENAVLVSGSPGTPAESLDIIGELLSKSPSFRQYAERTARPMIKVHPLQKSRDWQLFFGPVCGAAGLITIITVPPRCLFRGEKIIANDSFEKPGYGTRIMRLLVHRKLQLPPCVEGWWTATFSPNSLSSGIKMDTCDPALYISATISFVESCTFDMAIFGRAVL